VRRAFPDGRRYLLFLYDVVRIWKLPSEQVLAAGLGTLPLAPVAAVDRRELPDLIRVMERRLSAEAAPDEAASLWAATYVLMGLRYPAELGAQLLGGVARMKESVTYQAIVEEGRAEGRAEGWAEARTRLQKVLLTVGTQRLGPPTPQARAAIQVITDLDQLTRLSEQLLNVESWDELLSRA